ncbi:MAG: Rieske 2Fe-2S domain-containing protein [Dehalococcoidia bacterium]|nr:Rieske 2Fe-2S domain-containing protein [Dehalococcoidia bacterium]
MGNFVEVAKKDDLANGAMKEVKAQGQDVLLARVADKYYAIDNRCPHFGGNLSRGRLEGTVVTCPLHGSQFDITNGQVVRWLKGAGVLSAVGKALKSPKSVVTYKVKVEGDNVLVEI